MPILQKVVDYLNNFTNCKGLADAFQKGDKGQVAAEVAKLVAEGAAGGAVAAALRPAFPAVRLGLAITGNSHLWPTLGNALGASGIGV